MPPRQSRRRAAPIGGRDAVHPPPSSPWQGSGGGMHPGGGHGSSFRGRDGPWSKDFPAVSRAGRRPPASGPAISGRDDQAGRLGDRAICRGERCRSSTTRPTRSACATARRSDRRSSRRPVRRARRIGRGRAARASSSPCCSSRRRPSPPFPRSETARPARGVAGAGHKAPRRPGGRRPLLREPRKRLIDRRTGSKVQKMHGRKNRSTLGGPDAAKHTGFKALS